jgi:hypothetical protein
MSIARAVTWNTLARRHLGIPVTIWPPARTRANKISCVSLKDAAECSVALNDDDDDEKSRLPRIDRRYRAKTFSRG